MPPTAGATGPLHKICPGLAAERLLRAPWGDSSPLPGPTAACNPAHPQAAKQKGNRPESCTYYNFSIL